MTDRQTDRQKERWSHQPSIFSLFPIRFNFSSASRCWLARLPLPLPGRLCRARARARPPPSAEKEDGRRGGRRRQHSLWQQGRRFREHAMQQHPTRPRSIDDTTRHQQSSIRGACMLRVTDRMLPMDGQEKRREEKRGEERRRPGAVYHVACRQQCMLCASAG